MSRVPSQPAALRSEVLEASLCEQCEGLHGGALRALARQKKLCGAYELTLSINHLLPPSRTSRFTTRLVQCLMILITYP